MHMNDSILVIRRQRRKKKRNLQSPATVFGTSDNTLEKMAAANVSSEDLISSQDLNSDSQIELRIECK